MAEAKTKTIAGLEFNISQPFDEGHVCTAAEAKALNQTRSENIGNNMRKTIEEAIEARDKGDSSKFDALVETVAKYDAEYVFTLANVGGSRRLDPVEREARSIAREALKAHLAKTGRKIGTTPDGETDESWAEKVETNIDSISQREDVLKEAKKRVAAKQKQTESLTAGLEI